MAHHKYGPSTLDNLALCVRFKYDSEKNKDAGEEGTNLHGAAETGNLNGLSDEQKADVITCRNYAESLKFENGTSPDEWEDHAEMKVVLRELTHGKGDRFLFHEKSGVLHVIDFKFTRVDSEHGMQLKTYAAAYIEMQNLSDPKHPVKRVFTHVVAPRLGEPEVEEFVPGLLYHEVVSWIKELYERIEDPFNPPTAHVDVCVNCARAAHCPALGTTVVKMATSTGLPVPMSYNPEDTSSPRDMAIRQVLAGVVENWAKQVKKTNNAFVSTTGISIPYFKVMRRSTGLRVPKEKALAFATYVTSEHGITIEELLSCSNITVGDVVKEIAFKTGQAENDIKEELRNAPDGMITEGYAEYLTKEKRMSDTDMLKQLNTDTTKQITTKKDQ